MAVVTLGWPAGLFVEALVIVMERMASDPDLAQVLVVLVSAKGQDQTGLRLSGSIRVTRPQGFQLGEVVRTLEAIFNALAPGWHPSGSTEPVPAAEPAVSPAW